MKKYIAVVAVLALLIGADVAQAGRPEFKKGDAVAQIVELRINSASYRAKLKSEGIRIKKRVLCAYTPYIGIECTGTMVSKDVGEFSIEYTLTKSSATRGKLARYIKAKKDGSVDFKQDIVASTDIGLKRW